MRLVPVDNQRFLRLNVVSSFAESSLSAPLWPDVQAHVIHRSQPCLPPVTHLMVGPPHPVISDDSDGHSPGGVNVGQARPPMWTHWTVGESYEDAAGGERKSFCCPT